VCEQVKRSTDLSIIIVSWNTREILRRCIQSVFDTIEGLNYEVIVIDNDSHDGSPEMVERRFPQVHLLKNESNVGFSEAVNRGIGASVGSYVALVNSDVIVSEKAFEEMIHFLESNLDVGIVGCHLVDGEGETELTCDNFPTIPTRIFNSLMSFVPLLRRMFGRLSSKYGPYDQERDVEKVSGAFMVIRRRVFEQIGLLDENIFMYGEDTDLCYRTKQAGWRITYTPRATVIHLHGQSIRKSTLKSKWLRRKTMVYFSSKHYGWMIATFYRIIFSLFRSGECIRQRLARCLRTSDYGDSEMRNR
jgi:GT2 family glycosyltransferase